MSASISRLRTRRTVSAIRPILFLLSPRTCAHSPATVSYPSAVCLATARTAAPASRHSCGGLPRAVSHVVNSDLPLRLFESLILRPYEYLRSLIFYWTCLEALLYPSCFMPSAMSPKASFF
ncbi:hypothetical protein Bbelb_210070 [Branchiostoma belcheri]|nr:hypothetical protein Bbelb_210070 [Branchiostoma belcheri]